MPRLAKKERKRTRPPKVQRPPTPKHLRVSLPARIRNYFLAGILITAPIGITVWVAWNLVGWIDDAVTPLIPPIWNPETYLPFSVPGLGLVFLFLVLTTIGFLAAGLVGRSVMRIGERLLGQVPVVRSVYSATKQIFETVLSQQSTAFRQVALIEYPCRGTWALGFITGQTLGEVQDQTDETVYNVFIPATPNPTTGFLLFVPERDVHVVDMTVEDGIKLVVSGGIVTPPRAQHEETPPLDHAQAGESLEGQDAAGRIYWQPERTRAGAMARLRNYFFAGMLVTAPISITLWLVLKFVSFVDARFTPLIPPRWNPETYLPYDLPGLGLVVAFLGLTLIGMLTAGFTGRAITRVGESVLNVVPVVRSLYGAIKQITETVLAKKSNAFREVVLIQYPRPEVWALGFYTGDSHACVQDVQDREAVNVFLPTTPNPTSGFLLFVPRAEATKLAMTVEEGLKMVVSGGIVTPPAPEQPPEAEGEDETPPAADPERPLVPEEADAGPRRAGGSL